MSVGGSTGEAGEGVFILPAVDLTAPLDWNPDGERVVVIDSHTGGEPFRVVVAGAPAMVGDDMASRRRHAEANFDQLRKVLMWEPRGHADMYGALLGPPVAPGSDVSVLFMHNEGFSTMCGHGIIALTKVALETGVLPATEPKTTLTIDTPAGTVVATADVADGRVGRVRFRNVPSFVSELDATVTVDGFGEVRYDLAFGGGFYAYVDAGSVGLTCTPSDFSALVEAGKRIKAAVVGAGPISHPLQDDLGFLYGVIFTGPPSDPANHSTHVCVFADGEVDRSPTGTGVSGRLAIEHARGMLGIGETIVVESIIGSTFTGTVVETTEVGGLAAVIPEVGGEAHILGRSEFWIDAADGLGQGFLLR